MNYLLLVLTFIAIYFLISYLKIYLKTGLKEDRDNLLLSIIFPTILGVLLWVLGILGPNVLDTRIPPPKSTEQETNNKKDDEQRERCHKKTMDNLPAGCLFREKTL